MPNIDFESDYGRLGTALLNFWKIVEATASQGKYELNKLIGELKNISICSTEKPANTDTSVKLFNATVLNMDTPKKSLNRFNKVLIETHPHIHWCPNNTCKNQVQVREAEYYCATLVGKEINLHGNPFLFYSDKVFVGLFLLGANELYHEHLHPASKMWVILSGRARWKVAGEEGIVMGPGDYFIHPSKKFHTIETMDEPLLAMWAWTKTS